MCASTLCPFSSSTRNMALGNGSTTVPSTRIVSSLGWARPPTAYGLGCLGRAKRIARTAGATKKCTRPPEPLRIRGLGPALSAGEARLGHDGHGPRRRAAPSLGVERDRHHAVAGAHAGLERDARRPRARAAAATAPAVTFTSGAVAGSRPAAEEPPAGATAAAVASGAAGAADSGGPVLPGGSSVGPARTARGL